MQGFPSKIWLSLVGFAVILFLLLGGNRLALGLSHDPGVRLVVILPMLIVLWAAARFVAFRKK